MTPTIPTETALTPTPLNGGPASVSAEHEPADDGLPPFSDDILAQFREMTWLDAELNAGRLDQYYGEFVVSANHLILAHAPFYFTALEKAKVKADELRIPHEILTVYNIPCADPMRIE